MHRELERYRNATSSGPTLMYITQIHVVDNRLHTQYKWYALLHARTAGHTVRKVWGELKRFYCEPKAHTERHIKKKERTGSH